MNRPRLQLSLLKVGSCRHLECLALKGGRLAAVEFPSLAALIRHPTVGPILFDTGYAEHFYSATQPFPERLYRWVTPVHLPPSQVLGHQLDRLGIKLSDVGYCIVSHFHGDHVAGLKDLPKAQVIAMSSGYVASKNSGRLKGVLDGILPALLPRDLPSRLHAAEAYRHVELPAPWGALGMGYDFFGDGSLIGISLPGHHRGHLGVLLRDGSGRDVLLAADASWSLRAIREDRMPSSLIRPIIDNWHEYRATLGLLHRLVERHRELVVLPSHCDTTLGSYDKGWAAS